MCLFKIGPIKGRAQRPQAQLECGGGGELLRTGGGDTWRKVEEQKEFVPGFLHDLLEQGDHPRRNC